eukprot:364082-Chlamydomonas_euryale.AAC.4
MSCGLYCAAVNRDASRRWRAVSVPRGAVRCSANEHRRARGEGLARQFAFAPSAACRGAVPAPIPPLLSRPHVTLLHALQPVCMHYSMGACTTARACTGAWAQRGVRWNMGVHWR